MINFEAKAYNQLMINPRLPESEKLILLQLATEFEKEFGDNDYILVPSSGSAKKSDESVKLIALKIDRLLNSANRVNHYLKATGTDHWGLVLPDFHVAGLGVYARAYLMFSKVFKLAWEPKQIASQIEERKISFMSMVPTQVYELVKENIKAPASIKKIIVGGAPLSPDLRRAFVELGWPMVESYGMTETCSMIAVKEQDNDLYQLLNNVDVKKETQGLSIKCDSLLTATVQKIADKFEIKFFDTNAWYNTEDQVDLINMNAQVYLKFFGRKTDYIKILGEGVSLAELRERLEQVLLQLKYDINALSLIGVGDERAGSKLILVYNLQITGEQVEVVLTQFNSSCRAFEKISQSLQLEALPRTDLGKLKTSELKSIIEAKLKEGLNGNAE